VGPVDAMPEDHGLGGLERLNDANEMSLRTGGAAGTCAGPFFGFHQIGKKPDVRAGGGLHVGRANGAVRSFDGIGVHVSGGEKAFGSSEASEVVRLQLHGEETSEPGKCALEDSIRQM